MGSIRLVYDAEGDILDVDFRLTGKKLQRGIELHDNVTVWTDTHGTQILRLMFLSYTKLLEQPDIPLVKAATLAPPDPDQRPKGIAQEVEAGDPSDGSWLDGSCLDAGRTAQFSRTT